MNVLSLASYIGTNVVIPTDEDREDLYDDHFWIGDCFSNKYNKKDVKKYQFTTPFVYEISSHWGITIDENSSDEMNNKSLQKLKLLIHHLSHYIHSGDYFELYSCWIGEEDEQQLGRLIIHIDSIDGNTINIPEHTLITFQF